MTAKVSRICRFCSRVSEGLAEIAGSGEGASSVKDMGVGSGAGVPIPVAPARALEEALR